MKASFIIGLFLFLTTIVFSQTSIDVAEATFKVGGLGEEKVYYYGFCKGDQIVFSFEEMNNKKLTEIEIIEYPSSSKFMDFKTKKIENKIINVTQTGIYAFRFSNSALGRRICKYKIQRIPTSDATKNFNSSVYWRTVTDTTYYTNQEKYLIKKEYVPKAVLPSTDYYVNSGINATFQGGKSRITFPVNLPQNTVEWYYQFSASRNKEEIKKTKKTFNLLGQLTNLIDQTGALSFGINALTQPPGADYCDIYLLDYDNSRLFEAKLQYYYLTKGTRENIKSGIVKMNGGSGQSYYIGIKNPDNTHGVNVVIEVIVIVIEEEWGTRDVKKYNINRREEPYLKQSITID